MSINKIYFLFFFLIFASFTYAQKEANNWIFGGHQAFSFETNPPLTVLLPDNPIYYSRYNPISLSDSLGNLLFYSSKGRVFDSQHNEMPNGLTASEAGGFDVTHPVFVIPKPNTPNHYYQIVNGATYPNYNYLKVLEIDMTLNGGLGGIVLGSINEIHNNSDDKVTAVLHSNLQDIWIIHHSLNSNEFNAWLVTANGISSSPITTSIGNIINENSEFKRGQIKTSLDGKKLGMVYKDMSLLETFDFNRTTGELSNHFTFDQLSEPMGLEFSPSGRFVYINEAIPGYDSRILQLDLEIGNSNAISASVKEIAIADNFTTEVGSIQLASNGKIYISNRGQSNLAVINYPDLSGIACSYQEEGPIVNFTPTGLPVFFHPYLQQPFFVQEGLCKNEPTSFSIHESFTYSVDSVEWDFGDPNSGNENISKMLSPTHLFSSGGVFFVELTVYSDSIIYSYQGVADVALPQNPMDSIYQVCSNEVLELSVLTSGASYLWSDFSVEHNFEIETPGEYWVKISVDTCPSIIDSFLVEHLEIPQIDLGGFRGICDGGSVTLDATNPNSSYLWDTGATSSTIEVTQNANHSVTVTNDNGCVEIETVSVNHDNISSFPSQQNIFCKGDSNGIAVIFVEDAISPFTYKWNIDTISTYRKENLKAGHYSVTATDPFGCTTSQNFILTEPASLSSTVQITIDNFKTETFEGAIQVETLGGTPPYNYSIDSLTFQSNSLFENLKFGTYNLMVLDKNECQESLSIIIDSIRQEDKLELIKVFPNPASNKLFIHFPEKSNAEIQLFNSLGQIILTKNLDGFIKEYQINSEFFPDGIYFLNIKENEFSKTWKVIVKNE